MGTNAARFGFAEVVHGAVATVSKQVLVTKRVVENEKARVDCSVARSGIAGRCAGFNVSEPRVVAWSNQWIDGDASGADDRRLLR